MITDPYRSWDLEDFEPKFQEWQQEAQPSDDVAAQVEKWIETRRDNPYSGAFRRHDEPMFTETYWRALLPVLCRGQQVWCYYSVHENANAQEKRLVCEAFVSV